MSTELSTVQKNAFLSICWMAAHADGQRSESERDEIRRLAETLPGGDVRLDLLYTDVVAGLYKVEHAAATLDTPSLREQAYEMAAAICISDKDLTPPERRFLNELGSDLKMAPSSIERIERDVKILLTPPAPTPAPPIITSAPPTAAAIAATSTPTPAAPSPSPILASLPSVKEVSALDAEIDALVRKTAILAGALEIMPGAMANLAVVPLQMRMAYKIGKLHGYDMDQRSIAELAAAAGLASTSQLLEGYARKLLGGLSQKVGGGIGGAIGNQAASSGMAFASTYALGQLARRYYGGGRTLSGLQIKDTFSKLSDEAKALQGRFSGEIQQKAREVNPSQLADLVRTS